MNPVYRLTFTYYQLESRYLVKAVFEQEEGGKTQELVTTGVSIQEITPVRIVSGTETLEELSGIVPVLCQMMLARLDTEIPGVSDTL